MLSETATTLKYQLKQIEGGWRALLHTIHTFVPCVLVTSVFPIARCEKVLGAFTSYQSFLENGSTLQCVSKCQPAVRHDESDVRWDKCSSEPETYIFFFPPFLPLLIRLFFPTAILGNRWLPQFTGTLQ